MYIAQAYIGGQYAPADVLPEDLPKESIDRLLKAGAIKYVADEGIAQLREIAEARDDGETETSENTTKDYVQPEIESVFDDEATPEEIDVMEGLVGKETKKSARRRKST